MISLIVILIFGSVLIYYFRGFFFDKREEEIIKNTSSILNIIAESSLEEDFNIIKNWIRIVANINEGQAWLIDENGYLVMSYPFTMNLNNQVLFQNYEKIFEGKIIRQRVESQHFDNPMLLVGMPLQNQNEPNYGLLIFTSVAGINSTIDQIIKIMIYISLFAVILTFIVSYFWSKSLTTPLKKISNTAIKLSEGNLGETVDVKSENEIKVVADSLNYLSNTLKDTVNNLTEEKNKLKHVLKGMDEGVIVIGNNKKVILNNDSAKKLLNLESSIEESNLKNIIDNQEILDVFNESIKNQKTIQKELSIIDDKRIILYSSPIYNNDDKFFGIVCLIRDISERYRFEQLQKQFITNVSHELKTPLSSIKGAGEVLDDGIIQDEEKRKEYYKMIVKESNRLEDMVENILSISRLEEKKQNRKLNSFNIKDIVEETVKIFEEKKDKNQRIKLNIKNKNLKTNVNKNEIKQALINLIDNALKFSEKDTTVEVGLKDENNEIKVWVKDNGIGIDEKEIKNIWERFYQVDKTRSPDQDGTGLGLSIVKQLIERNQGRVYVKSKVNHGSEFGFYLPLNV
ncbi:MAG: ATP-binding protein [Halanaerobiales bacterium]|nr:ATP-binding protein [Halanaerobiales bacterium]